jgi:ubiquinone/menaquinone biosynthesis C-methylase UbiE
MDPKPIAEAYAKLTGRAPFSIAARKALRLSSDEGNVLDVACGPGYFLAQLAKLAPHKEIHGLDISPNMLSLAKDTLQKRNLDAKVQLHLGSAFDLPFEDNSLDLVTNSNFLHQIDDPSQFLYEMVRVLKPGGTGIIFDFTRDVPSWVRSLAYLHTRYTLWKQIPLDGMGRVIDACFTIEEIEGYLEKIPSIKWKIERPLMMVITTIWKEPI